MTPLLSMLAGARAFGLTAFRNLFEPQGAFDALASVTVPSGGATSVIFSGIPTGYKHLQIRMLTRSSEPVSLGGVYMRLNSDSGSNYSWHRVYGNGSTGLADSAVSATWMLPGITPTTSNAANIFGSTIIDILDYNSVTKNKTIKGFSGVDFNGSGNVALHSGSWYNAFSPVASISIVPFSGSWQEYSNFALYGVK
jgi:hypothetical protein